MPTRSFVLKRLEARHLTEARSRNPSTYVWPQISIREGRAEKIYTRHGDLKTRAWTWHTKGLSDSTPRHGVCEESVQPKIDGAAGFGSIHLIPSTTVTKATDTTIEAPSAPARVDISNIPRNILSMPSGTTDFGDPLDGKDGDGSGVSLASAGDGSSGSAMRGASAQGLRNTYGEFTPRTAANGT